MKKSNIYICSWEILLPKKDNFFFVQLSHFLKVFITFDIFSNFWHQPHWWSERDWRISDALWVFPKVSILKSSIIVVHRLALHQNGVEFCQKSICDIRISLAMSHDIVHKVFCLFTHKLTNKPTKLCMEAGMLPKNKNFLLTAECVWKVIVIFPISVVV